MAVPAIGAVTAVPNRNDSLVSGSPSAPRAVGLRGPSAATPPPSAPAVSSLTGGSKAAAGPPRAGKSKGTRGEGTSGLAGSGGAETGTIGIEVALQSVSSGADSHFTINGRPVRSVPGLGASVADPGAPAVRSNAHGPETVAAEATLNAPTGSLDAHMEDALEAAPSAPCTAASPVWGQTVLPNSSWSPPASPTILNSSQVPAVPFSAFSTAMASAAGTGSPATWARNRARRSEAAPRGVVPEVDEPSRKRPREQPSVKSLFWQYSSSQEERRARQRPRGDLPPLVDVEVCQFQTGAGDQDEADLGSPDLGGDVQMTESLQVAAHLTESLRNVPSPHMAREVHVEFRLFKEHRGLLFALLTQPAEASDGETWVFP